MGGTAYVCGLSGLPIGWNTKVLLIALVEGERYRVDQTGKIWWPCALPLVGRYQDDSRSLRLDKLEDSDQTTAFFEGLDQRILERPEGEYPWHEPAITKGMSREILLHCLREDRLQIKGPDLAVLTITQALVRADIWRWFVREADPRLDNLQPYEVYHALYISTLIPHAQLKDPRFLTACREMISVRHTMHNLGRQWEKGRPGPQEEDWSGHMAFARKRYRIAKRRLAKYAEDAEVEEWKDGELVDLLPKS